jgi:RNA polymerase sigma-70 factor (ECF subfamily)
MVLIEGCINNDRRAQEELYKHFYGSMNALCLQYTNNNEDALEVLHNGFLKVFKNIGKYRDTKGSLYTWIRTIIVHTAIDFIRQHDRVFTKTDLDSFREQKVEVDVLHRLSAQGLPKLLKRLPTSTQAVFNLFVVEGYSHREIAIIQNISEGTSNSHLSQARKTLLALITAHHSAIPPLSKAADV